MSISNTSNTSNYGFFKYRPEECSYQANYNDHFVNQVNTKKIVTIHDNGRTIFQIDRDRLGKLDEKVGYNEYMQHSLVHREEVYFQSAINKFYKNDPCFQKTFLR